MLSFMPTGRTANGDPYWLIPTIDNPNPARLLLADDIVYLEQVPTRLTTQQAEQLSAALHAVQAYRHAIHRPQYRITPGQTSDTYTATPIGPDGEHLGTFPISRELVESLGTPEQRAQMDRLVNGRFPDPEPPADN